MNILAAIVGALFVIFGCFCLDRYINIKRKLIWLELAVIGLIHSFYIIGLV